MADETDHAEEQEQISPEQTADDDSAVLLPPSNAVPVVGVGASAGGIEALSNFFDAMPVDAG
ncbi:MAG: hypothetical protein ABI369_15175, partial [Acetobacteraceae bacterium]